MLRESTAGFRNREGSITQRDELIFAEKLRLQFEKFVRDIQHFQPDRAHPLRKKLDDNLDRYSQDLAKLSEVVNHRYSKAELQLRQARASAYEAEARVSELEKDLELQLERNSELDMKLYHLREKESEVSRVSIKNEKQDEKLIEYITEINEFGGKFKELEEELAETQKKLSLKEIESEELRYEIRDLYEELDSIRDAATEETQELISKLSMARSMKKSKRGEKLDESIDSQVSTKSEYKKKLEEVEHEAEQQEDYVGNLKLEIAKLQAELESKELEREESENLESVLRESAIERAENLLIEEDNDELVLERDRNSNSEQKIAQLGKINFYFFRRKNSKIRKTNRNFKS